MDRKNWNSDADWGAQNMLQAFRISASRETGGLWVRAAKAAGLSVEAWACSILDEAARSGPAGGARAGEAEKGP